MSYNYWPQIVVYDFNIFICIYVSLQTLECADAMIGYAPTNHHVKCLCSFYRYNSFWPKNLVTSSPIIHFVITTNNNLTLFFKNFCVSTLTHCLSSSPVYRGNNDSFYLQTKRLYLWFCRNRQIVLLEILPFSLLLKSVFKSAKWVFICSHFLVVNRSFRHDRWLFSYGLFKELFLQFNVNSVHRRTNNFYHICNFLKIISIR